MPFKSVFTEANMRLNKEQRFCCPSLFFPPNRNDNDGDRNITADMFDEHEDKMESTYTYKQCI